MGAGVRSLPGACTNPRLSFGWQDLGQKRELRGRAWLAGNGRCGDAWVGKRVWLRRGLLAQHPTAKADASPSLGQSWAVSRVACSERHSGVSLGCTNQRADPRRGCLRRGSPTAPCSPSTATRATPPLGPALAMPRPCGRPTRALARNRRCRQPSARVPFRPSSVRLATCARLPGGQLGVRDFPPRPLAAPWQRSWRWRVWCRSCGSQPHTSPSHA